MAMQCTDGFRFRSICTYSCTQPGYDIPPGKRRALVCQANKRWSGQRVGCKGIFLNTNTIEDNIHVEELE